MTTRTARRNSCSAILRHAIAELALRELAPRLGNRPHPHDAGPPENVTLVDQPASQTVPAPARELGRVVEMGGLLPRSAQREQERRPIEAMPALLET